MMAKRKRSNSHPVSGKGSVKGDLKAAPEKHVAAGHEVWRIAKSGRFVTLKTSRSSIRAMDEAVTKYDRALRRLADR
jgi:hypothetical protein